MSKITIKDIARESGVSITSVSFILNGKTDSVSKETKERVLDVCKKYNYQPNYLAAALKSKSTHFIGILVPDIENSYYSRILKILEDIFDKKGYSLLISSSGYDLEKFMGNIRNLVSKSIDYCIVIPPSSFQEQNKEELARLSEHINVSFVIFDRKINYCNCPVIVNDDIQGGYLATNYLIKKGHKKIYCITGSRLVSSSIDRLTGYKKALEENNIKYDESLIYEGDYKYADALDIASKILKKDKNCSVFAFNDLMAYAVYKVANELGLKIGKDVSVVGFDDNNFSNLIYPGLTTIRQNVQKLCEAVAEELFLEDCSARTITIEPELIERGSVNDSTIK
ncbi:MAG: LacI family DNA-binding transcriptional regulator [Bacilli bacterium]|nr:LacI family DNA-binding transcriptional regulator [Bacilli bacterium]